MKKGILIAILVSVLCIAGGYYYLYIMTPEEETPIMPAKVKLAVKPQPVPADMSAKKDAVQVPKSKKKEDPKKEPEKKKETAAETKAAAKKEEKKEPESGKEIAKDKKPAKIAEKRQKKKAAAKKPKGYKIEFIAGSEEEALKAKNDLVGKGYHTAKYFKTNNSHVVSVFPFTDKWEAEYVMKNIVKDTSISGLSVKPVH